VTVPCGVIPPDEVTVAVSTTVWPSTDGFTDDVNEVEVPVEEIVSLSVEEELAAKAALPANAALMLCGPARPKVHGGRSKAGPLVLRGLALGDREREQYNGEFLHCDMAPGTASVTICLRSSKFSLSR